MTSTANRIPAILERAPEVSLAAGERVFCQGQKAENYLFVTRGDVRVFARSSEGREVTLYHVDAGEMCTLTTSCMLGKVPYPAEAITESTVTAKVLGAGEFNQALHESTEFRQFVFSSFSTRLATLMRRMEQLVLDSVHDRLSGHLRRKASSSGEVFATHEQLAQEIGSAREVVSRHLKIMENQGLVELHRGRIILLPTGDWDAFEAKHNPP